MARYWAKWRRVDKDAGLFVLAVDFVADEGVKPGRMPLEPVVHNVRGHGALIKEQAEHAVLEQPFKDLPGKWGGGAWTKTPDSSHPPEAQIK